MTPYMYTEQQTDQNVLADRKVMVFHKTKTALRFKDTPTTTIGAYNDTASFGQSVALTDWYLLVGASEVNTAYIFLDKRAISGHGSKWDTKAATVIDKYGTTDSEFGYSVTITNQYAMIGAPGENAIYIFGQQAQKWSAKALHVIKHEDIVGSVANRGDRFGASVCITDKYGIVGAPHANKAFIFSMHDNGTSWNTKPVVLDGYTSAVNFGTSVSMSNFFAIVGAPSVRKVFIFKRKPGTHDWGTKAVTVIGDSTSDDESEFNVTDFGYSVHMQKNAAIVGAFGAQKAFVFGYDRQGWNSGDIPAWLKLAAVEFSGNKMFTLLGVSLHMSEKHVILGALGTKAAICRLWSNEPCTLLMPNYQCQKGQKAHKCKYLLDTDRMRGYAGATRRRRAHGTQVDDRRRSGVTRRRRYLHHNNPNPRPEEWEKLERIARDTV